MGPMSAMPLLLCVLSVSLSSQAGLTVEAEPGDDVTLWCEHSLTRADYLYWLKQTNNSVPVYIACKFYTLSSSDPCYFIPESERSVMRVNSTFSSLTITAVTPSDSGLYYCSIQGGQQMIFSTTTYLQIKVDCIVFLMLAAMFPAVTVILLILLIVQCIRKQQGNGKYSNVDDEAVNYAALHFKKNKRSEKNVTEVDPNVVYSSQ
uniref:Ig-like domain-containing protein n=1 Tax=Pygocentrus nattereri TaxID=42514 RepID=A0AAR2KLQ7_PYGNA